jgi:NAD dependent epimerase/dehydratase family enzyme
MAAPNPVTNKELHKKLRKTLGVPFGIPQPKFLLEFGAWLIGTETELILKSRYVISKRLPEEGFTYKFPTIETCLEDIFS